MKRSSRRYTKITLRMLWGRSAGRCAMTDCRVELLEDDPTGFDPVVNLADVCHLNASSDRGPRPNRSMKAKDRDSYENLVLLCKRCHPKLDGHWRRRFPLEKARSLREDHEAWVRAMLPARVGARNGWSVVFLEGEHPIDRRLALEALAPEGEKEDPCSVEVDSRQDWERTRQVIRQGVRRILRKKDAFGARIAVFPLAPVSACVALGYYLTSRPVVRLFQYHRKNSSWVWPRHGLRNAVRVSGLPRRRDSRVRSVAILFELSSRISAPSADVIVRVSTPSPSTSWLGSPEQLSDLATHARETFEALSDRVPRASWRLFVAGPAPAAVEIGRQLNPTTVPEVQLHEFTRANGHVPSIVLRPD